MNCAATGTIFDHPFSPPLLSSRPSRWASNKIGLTGGCLLGIWSGGTYVPFLIASSIARRCRARIISDRITTAPDTLRSKTSVARNVYKYKLDAAELGIGPLLAAWVDVGLEPGEEKGDSGGRLGAVKGVDEVLDGIETVAEPEGVKVTDIFQSQERKSFKDAWSLLR